MHGEIEFCFSYTLKSFGDLKEARQSMPIPPDMSFACFALDGPLVRERGVLPFQVSDTLEVHSALPVGLDETWTSWLGNIQARKLGTSHFFVLYLRPIAHRGTFEAEALEALRYYHLALLLQGAGYSEDSLLICGRTPGARLSIDSLRVVPRHGYVPHSRPTPITTEVLTRALPLSQVIRAIHLPRYRFSRLRRGLAAWSLAIQSYLPEVRLHNSIRAVEAVSKPTRGGVTQAFMRCGKLHAGEKHRNVATLKQLYDLRSCIEHVKLWRKELKVPEGFSANDAFLFRTLQAEILASHIYMRILENPRLLSRMGTYQTIDRFWDIPFADLQTQHGGDLDLRRAGMDRFLTAIAGRH